jgi:thiol-disulfide isomerase/thioredoxin
VTKWSGWAAGAFFVAFAAFSAKVKMDVAKAEALDSFQGRISYGVDAPDFTLDDTDGNSVALADQVAEGEVILLNFWATWCPPCRLEMPLLDELQETYGKDGLRILAINVGEDQATVESFLSQRPVSFQVLMDTDQRIAARYHVEAFPTTVLLDDEGKVIEVIEGLDPYIRYSVGGRLEWSKDEEAERETP